MARTPPPPPDPAIDALVRDAALDELRACHAGGPYPCPEAEIKTRTARRLKGRAPARGIRTRIGRALESIATVDRPRLGTPRHVVFPGDEDRLYAAAPQEIRAAVELLRVERSYPVSLAALGARLRLTRRGRTALAERLLGGDVPPGLALVLCGRARTPKLTLAGEEDFDRPLRKHEQLDLRIRLADLRRGAAGPRPRAAPFAESFAAAYDHLAREERTRFVPLPRLREAMPAWDRATFDARVVELCERDLYQLSEHEHPARLTDEERAAALTWGSEGRPYHFVSRT